MVVQAGRQAEGESHVNIEQKNTKKRTHTHRHSRHRHELTTTTTTTAPTEDRTEFTQSRRGELIMFVRSFVNSPLARSLTRSFVGVDETKKKADI